MRAEQMKDVAPIHDRTERDCSWRGVRENDESVWCRDSTLKNLLSGKPPKKEGEFPE